MNDVMIYLSGILNPVAFALGAGLTMQVWRMKNPICLVFALLLFSYQTRNLITAIAVPAYSAGLVRPTGLLIWSNIGRVIEICGTSVAILYFAGKAQLIFVMRWFLSEGQIHSTPRSLVSGELPPSFWRQTFAEVVRENIKDEFLK